MTKMFLGDNLIYDSGESNTIVPDVWTPPSDWIDITQDVPNDGIVLLWSDMAESSFPTAMFTCTVSGTGGTYHVNWGDGTAEDIATNVTASHSYIVGTGTPCSRGYTTFKIVITPNNQANLNTFTVSKSPAPTDYGWIYLGLLWAVIGTSTLTSLDYMFGKGTYTSSWYYNHCKYLEAVKFVGSTSLATSANSTFTNAQNLKSISGDGFDTSNVTTMNSMFLSCYSLPFIPYMNTSKVAYMSNIFDGCYSLLSLPLGFDTTNVTNLNSAFRDCRSITSLPLLNTSKCTSFPSAFNNCYNLRSVPSLDISNSTASNSMFSGCYNLKSIGALNSTSKNTNVGSMFYGCGSLKSLQALGDTSKSTNLAYLFSGCSSLEYLGFNTIDGSSATTFANMFLSCYLLKSVPNIISSTSLTDCNNMFNNCNSLKEIPIFDTSSVTNMNGMLGGCANLLTIPSFNTSKVTNFNSFMSNCYKVQYIPSLDLSSATNVQYMFSTCTSLREVPVFINMIKATSFSGIFNSCNMMSGDIDYRTDTAGIVTFAFTNCYLLKSILLPNTTAWGTSAPQIDILNCYLDANSLNALFNSLGTVTGKTIRITGNPGVSTCDKTIATNKGWTVQTT